MSTKIFALGGLGEVGKNMYCVETKNEIMLIDSGIMFADEDLPGVSGLIPDVKYLIDNVKKITGMYITHGHLDHIGGIPYVMKLTGLRTVHAPLLAAELIKEQLKEHKIKDAEYQIFDKDSVIKTKEMEIRPFVVNHSMPDCFGFSIKTEDGHIVTTGDFKFDLTPVVEACDMQRIAAFGKEGVDLLLADSTNALQEGFSASEGLIARTIDDIISTSKGRVFFSTFASNVGRVKQAIETGVKHNRKIICYGRSMDKNVTVSKRIKYIDTKPDSFADDATLKSGGLKDREIMILSTGSQGEEMAALGRMADGRHNSIKLKPTDTIILSSNAIPGNFYNVEKLTNKLARHGVRLIDTSYPMTIHASGHGSKGEQQIMLSLVKPKHFMPVHGERRMLKGHRNTYLELGGTLDKSFICENGETLILDKGVVSRGEKVHSGVLYIDGRDITGMTSSIVRDRESISKEGAMSVIVTIDPKNNKLLSKPLILSRGSFFVKDAGEVIKESQKRVQEELNKLLEGRATFSAIKSTIRKTIQPIVYKLKKRRPLIIPVIIGPLPEDKKEKTEDKQKEKQA